MPRSDVDEAKGVLEVLAGTLIPDLRSMMKWAGEFNARAEMDPGAVAGLGALNYTLMMVALIGCETLGFYTEGAHKHADAITQANPGNDGGGWRRLVRRLFRCGRRSVSRTRLPDPGTYMIQFIDTYFSNESDFKRLPKVLADGLRHALVHGFGSLAGYPGVCLDLAVHSDVAAHQSWPLKREGKDSIGMNAIALAAHFLTAFKRVADLVEAGSDPALINRMATAARLELPTSKGVQNQFRAAYQALERRRRNP